MKRNRIVISVLFILTLSIGVGCSTFELGKDTEGNPQTQIEGILDEVSEGLKNISPVANLAFPGSGTVATGLALLLSLVGNGITSVVARKRGTALSTVIAGVEEGTKKYDDMVNAIVSIVHEIDPKAADKLNKEAGKYKNIKELVKEASIIVGNSSYVDSYVQSVTKKMKAA